MHTDRQFNRVFISVKDMERAVEFAATAASGKFAQDHTVQRALITAAIVSYARPFSGNEDHERATATPPDILKHLITEEHKLHDKLCELRNQALAHSDFELNPVRPAAYQGTGFLVASRTYDPLEEGLNVREIHALAEKVKSLLRAKLHQLSAVVTKHS
jgi:hypothetical protein